MSEEPQNEEVQDTIAAAQEAEGGSGLKIGDQTFRNEKDAFEYAQKHIEALERDRAIADAYSQGQKEAMQHFRGPGEVTSTERAQEPEEDNFDQEFYEDPKAYLKKYGAQIREQAKQEVLGQVEQTQAEAQLWRDFFSKNEDLDGFRDEVELVLTQNRAQVEALAKAKGKDAAFDLLANATRRRFYDMSQRLRPKRELPNVKIGASEGTGEEVTRKEAPKGSVDFLSQLRKTKRRR